MIYLFGAFILPLAAHTKKYFCRKTIVSGLKYVIWQWRYLTRFFTLMHQTIYLRKGVCKTEI